MFSRLALAVPLAVLVTMVASARPAPQATPVARAASTAQLRVDGRLAPFRAILINGSSYVPLEGIAQELGLTVEWDPDTDAVAVNGSLLRARPRHLDGGVFLPVAPLARLLGLQLGWDVSSRTLTLDRATARRTPTRTPVAATPTPTATATPSPSPSGAHRLPFTPVQATDGTFHVTVTDLTELDSVRGYYHPRPGYKFVMVNLSQQNVSDALQIYTGRFILVDNKGEAYDPLENLSNFWLVILRPGGINFGYLMYELPVAAKPAKIVLDTRDRAPLQVSL